MFKGFVGGRQRASVRNSSSLGSLLDQLAEDEPHNFIHVETGVHRT